MKPYLPKESLQKEIQDHRIWRKREIAVCNYEEAKRIDETIKIYQNTYSFFEFDALKDKLVRDLQNLYESKESEILKLQRKKIFDLDQIKCEYNSMFEQINNRFFGKLSRLEQDFNKLSLYERSRRVPAQYDLYQQSNKAAIAGEYDLATEILKKSSEEAEKVYHQREKNVGKKYEYNRSVVLLKYKESLDVLSKRFLHDIRVAESVNDELIENTKKQRDTQLSGITLKYMREMISFTPAKFRFEHSKIIQDLYFDFVNHVELIPVQFQIENFLSTKIKDPQLSKKQII